MIKRISVLILIVVGIMQMGIAQKFGHINSTQLLLELPSVKTADKELETYQKQLVDKGQTLVTDFQKDYEEYAKKAEARTYSNAQMQQEEAKLANAQQAIQVYEQEMKQKLYQKREVLYKPILESLKNILDEIGSEGNYTMIFDSSTGGLLHATDSEDLMPVMRSKLGL